LYKHIPFYIKLSKSHASGFYYNNTFPAHFDMGSEISGYRLNRGYYRANGGDIDYFVINGPSIREVTQRFTDLVGKSVLLPLEAYGIVS
jgi:alpha-glucosidase